MTPKQLQAILNVIEIDLIDQRVAAITWDTLQTITYGNCEV